MKMPGKWVPFGSHVDSPIPLVFAGEGEDGLPEWERPALTSDMFTEEQRCTISELPLPWCGCWVCRPDVAEGIPGCDYTANSEEN